MWADSFQNDKAQKGELDFYRWNSTNGFDKAAPPQCWTERIPNIEIKTLEGERVNPIKLLVKKKNNGWNVRPLSGKQLCVHTTISNNGIVKNVIVIMVALLVV